MSYPVQSGWNNLLARVHRRGPLATAVHVSDLIRKGRLSPYYTWRLATYAISSKIVALPIPKATRIEMARNRKRVPKAKRNAAGISIKPPTNK